MSFNAKLFFSQKKGTVYSLVLLMAVAVMVVGILSVNAAYVRTITVTPTWAGAGFANQTYNFSVTNVNGGTITEVRITKPTNFVDVYCLSPVPAGWQCTTNGTNENPSKLYVEFTTGTLALGSSISFNISSTTASSAGENDFSVRTTDDSNPVNTTTSTVSIDTLAPKLNLLNVSDGTRNLTGGTNFNGLRFLGNASGRIDFVFLATDNESGMQQVVLYYNATNASSTDLANRIVPVDHRTGASYDTTVTMSNGSMGNFSIYNASLSGELIKNGTLLLFSVVANDSVRTGNVSNYTSVGEVRTYNFSIDAAAPAVVDVQIANYTQVNTNGNGSAINTTKTFGSLAGLEYIVNSSVLLNISILVRDDGGSGVVNVEVMNRSGTYMPLQNITGAGTNGSSTQTTWNLNFTGRDAWNITDLARRGSGLGFNGDGLYNLSFRITDNVSNVLNYNFSVEVDDVGPSGAAFTNITVNGNLSEGNATQALSTLNESVVLRLQTSNNVNNVTRNISVFGNLGLVFNFTKESGTPSGTSVWNYTVVNLTRDFCNIIVADGQQCNLRFNFSDVMGRVNDSINLTIVVDGLVPNVTILSPVSQTTNYSTTVSINASVNDSVGPLRNVSFRWRNTTAATDAGNPDGANVSSWFPMSLYAGSNSPLNTQGYWSASLTISSLLDGNYTIEINATDSSGRQNATSNVTNVIFDSTRPYNVSITLPAANSFHKDNTTFSSWGATPIRAVANESGNSANANQSGIKNVSFRLENSSFSWPWVPSNATSAFAINANGVLHSPQNVNLTHWGGELINASNGNFTIRLNVTDTAGNQNTTVTINVTIDTVPPASVTFINPANNINQSRNFTINISAVESNFDTVTYRWENASDVDGNSVQRNVSSWFPMNNVGGANNWNATFYNMTTVVGFLDGNYTIRVNVTDKAGWSTAAYIQLVLDKTIPAVGVGKNSVASSTFHNGTGTSFVVNVTINDTSSLNTPPLGVGAIVATNINATSYQLINRTKTNSSDNITGNVIVGATGMQLPMASNGGNYSNASFTFASVPNGVYDINVTVNDTAGNINYTIIANVTFDNTVPMVRAINTTPAASGGAGIGGTVIINASVNDNIGINPNGIDNASVNVTFVSAAGIAASYMMTAPGDRERWNASVDTTAIANGDYQIFINATDKSGNVNSSEFVRVTIQNGATNPTVNWSFVGGFISGSDLTNPVANSTPKILFNTSENATCKYSIDTQYQKYQHLPNTASNNVSKSHNAVLGPLRDGVHTIYYSCFDVAGSSMPLSGNNTEDDTFNVDTRTLWNVTIPGKTDNRWPNYFQAAAAGSANGWSSFSLATGALADTTLASAIGGYNVTNVLASLLKGTAAGNFTRVYAYTASTNSWESFVVGQTANSLVNFTNQTTYWINVTAVERLEIN
ncbi:hypothetical protein HYU17_02235 [Candidatus Woesearchaeota archaeon]|nr:hypothetical protein [Candidatus Woesearchaeota archaeon]